MADVPQQVGPYRIVRVVGRGGMAVVYLARQPALSRDVAVKELARVVASDPALASRFIREARVAGSLNHPNVVTVYDFLEQDGVPYIAMEYLERDHPGFAQLWTATIGADRIECTCELNGKRDFDVTYTRDR